MSGIVKKNASSGIKMMLSRNERSGFYCPVCHGTSLEPNRYDYYYDTVCRGCGARFMTEGYTPEEFAEEIELGAENLDWNGLSIEQVMAMAANMDPYVANAFRDNDLYLWINNYFGYIRDISHGNDSNNHEWADQMGSLIKIVMQDPSDIIELLTGGDMGYTEQDLYDRLLAIHARYSRLRRGSGYD